MIKIKQLDDIFFTYPLWVEESRISTAIQSTNTSTINGSLVIFEQYNKLNANTLTCISMDNGWIKKDILEKLLLLSNSSLGEIYSAVFTDGSVKKVIFNHEAGAVSFEPIYEGSEYYKGTINLLEAE